jgi:hypothetical protein
MHDDVAKTWPTKELAEFWAWVGLDDEPDTRLLNVGALIDRYLEGEVQALLQGTVDELRWYSEPSDAAMRDRLWSKLCIGLGVALMQRVAQGGPESAAELRGVLAEIQAMRWPAELGNKFLEASAEGAATRRLPFDAAHVAARLDALRAAHPDRSKDDLVSDLAGELGCSPKTVYNRLKESPR